MIALPLLLLSLLFAHAAHGSQPPAGTATATATASPGVPAVLPSGTAAPAAPPAPATTPPGAAPLPSATPPPGPTPVSSATPVASPMPGASATPTAAPSAGAGTGSPLPASPSPQPSPLAGATTSPYKYRFVPHPPTNVQPGQPVIVAVYLNSLRLRSEGPILIKVQTNEAVVKVVSRSNGREGAIPRVTEGDFEAASKLPKLPFIASGMTIDLEFVATSADGRKTSVRIPVKLN